MKYFIHLLILCALSFGMMSCAKLEKKPVSAKVMVYSMPPTGESKIIRLSDAQWKTISPLLPDFDSIEGKIIKSPKAEFIIVFQDKNNAEFAEGFFIKPGKLQVVFSSGMSAIYDVSNNLEKEINAVIAGPKRVSAK